MSGQGQLEDALDFSLRPEGTLTCDSPALLELQQDLFKQLARESRNNLSGLFGHRPVVDERVFPRGLPLDDAPDGIRVFKRWVVVVHVAE